MKNLIVIDVDTEREKQILIGKPQESTPPSNPKDAALMVTTDISCVCEALCTLINISDQSGYAKKADLIAAAVKRLNDMLIVSTDEVKQPAPDEETPTTDKV